MTKKRVVLLLLLVTTISLGTSTQSIAAVKPAKSQAFYEDALEHYRTENFTEATIQLRNALQQDPNNLPARILLGRILLRINQVPAAITEFETALGLGGDKNLILVPLGQAYLEYLEPEKLLTNIVPGRHEPEVEAELLMLHAQAHQMLGQEKEAETAYVKASSLLPADPRPQLAMAKIAAAKGKRTKAVNLVEQALGLAPEDFDVWLYKALLHRDSRQYATAAQAFERALQLRPTSGEALTGRAAMRLDLGRADLALEDLQKAVDLEVDTIETTYLRTIILFGQGKHDEAREILRESADFIRNISEEARERLPKITLMLGVIAYFNDNYSEAVNHFQKYLSQSPNHMGAKRYLASSFLALGDYDSLVKVYQPSPRVKPPNDPTALSMLAEAYRAKGNFKLAERYYAAALVLAPRAAGLGVKLAMSRLDAGKAEQALTDLKRLIEALPDLIEAKIQLCHLYVKIREVDIAKTYAAELVSTYPDNAAVQSLAGAVYTMVGDLERAREHTNMAAALAPEAILPQLNLARIAQRQGHIASAETKYRELLQTYPTNERASIELATLLVQQGELDEAKERLDLTLQNHPNSFDANKLALQLDMREDFTPARARDRVYALLEKFPKNPRAHIFAGEINRQIGDRDEAKRLFRQAAEKAGFDSAMLTETARSQINLDDMNGALWSLTKAVQGGPNNIDAATLRVTVLIDSGDFEQSKESLDALLEKFGPVPQIQNVQAHWHMAQGQHEPAIALFEQVHQQAPSRDSVATLFRAYQTASLHDKGRGLLREWTALHPDDIFSRHQLAQTLIAKKDYVGAKDVYEALRQDEVEDLLLLNNLAAVYQRLGDKRALQTIKAAYKLAPEDANVLDTYGWILTEIGRVKEGLKMLREAFARQSSGPEIRYHIGLALVKLGKEAEAAEELEASLESDVWFADANDAKALLSKLKPETAQTN